MNNLTDQKIKNLKAKDKLYTVNDGRGLYLEVTPKGSKRWRFRFKLNGTPKLRSLGTYPDVSLAVARKRRDEARRILAEEGRDPFIKQEEEQQKTKLTFKEASMMYADDILSKKSDSHYKRTVNAWNKYAYPLFGDKAMNDITDDDVRQLIMIHKEKGIYDSAQKILSSINNVYLYIMNTYTSKSPFEKVLSNPTINIKLSIIFGDYKQQSYPIITDPTELAALMDNIRNYNGFDPVRLALYFIANTVVRPSNIRHATWDQIDWESKQWVIPARLMKTRKEFIVPLSDQAIAILKEAKSITDGELIFPSPRGKNTPLSDGALVSALRRMGYTSKDIVAHSFRAMFATIANEKSPFDRDVIDLQLAHTIGSKVSQAYNRAERLPERRELMQWWSEVLDG